MYQPTDLTDMNHTTLISTLISAHGEMTRFKALFILALADFHSRCLARELGSPSTTSWLMRTLNVAESTSFEYLRVGTTLAKFPLVAAAFLAGDLSYSVVRILAAHLTEENEAELLASAKSLTIAELRALLAGAGKPEAPLSEQFSIHIDEDTGWLKFHGRISPENAARLLAGLKIAELGNLVDLSELDSEVLADETALNRELEKAGDSPVAVPAEGVTPAQPSPDRRAGTGFGAPRRSNLLPAFLSMVNMIRCRPTNKLRTPGAQVNLLVSENGRVVMPSIPGASSSALVAAALNGDVRAHLLDKRGVQLAASRAQRLVGDTQVNALMARWHFQCAMPGCNHSRFLEFHHIVFSATGERQNCGTSYRCARPAIRWSPPGWRRFPSATTTLPCCSSGLPAAPSSSPRTGACPCVWNGAGSGTTKAPSRSTGSRSRMRLVGRA